MSSANCTDTSVCTQVDPTSSIEEVLLNSVELYPNPVDHQLTIDFTSEIDQLSIRVTNLAGQKMIAQEFENVKIVDLSLVDFESGVYFVVIQMGTVSKSIKVVKL